MQFKYIIIVGGCEEIDCEYEYACFPNVSCHFGNGTCCFTTEPVVGTAVWKRGCGASLDIEDHTVGTRTGKFMY